MRRYMVVERFKAGCWEAAYDRFRDQGRLLPEGLYYLNSWASREHQVCYQLMETASPALFDIWFSCWSDLVTFELVEID